MDNTITVMTAWFFMVRLTNAESWVVHVPLTSHMQSELREYSALFQALQYLNKDWPG